MFPRPDFFESSLLNFAENLLYPPNISIQPSDIAIIASTESSNGEITWGELRVCVASMSIALRKLGVKMNDRVAGFLGNHEKTVIAMLAATSIGAIWTGISPDTGVSAVLDRLVQIEPVSINVPFSISSRSGFNKFQKWITVFRIPFLLLAGCSIRRQCSRI